MNQCKNKKMATFDKHKSNYILYLYSRLIIKHIVNDCHINIYGC